MKTKTVWNSGGIFSKVGYLFSSFELNKNVDLPQLVKMIKSSKYLSIEKLNVGALGCDEDESIIRSCLELNVINKKIVLRLRYDLGEVASIEDAQKDALAPVNQIKCLVELYEDES